MNKELYFMHFYMLELESLLNLKKDELLAVSFQSDEANTVLKPVSPTFTHLP